MWAITSEILSSGNVFDVTFNLKTELSDKTVFLSRTPTQISRSIFRANPDKI